MFVLMLAWRRRRDGPRAFVPSLAVIVFLQFYRIVFMIVLMGMLMFVIMTMFMAMLMGMILLCPKHFARQFHFTVDVNVHLGSGDTASIHP